MTIIGNDECAEWRDGGTSGPGRLAIPSQAWEWDGGPATSRREGEADMPSEIQFPATFPGSTSFDAWVIDNDGHPGNVLEAGRPFTIKVKWAVSHAVALILGGEWEVKAYAESIGPGPEPKLGDTMIVPVNGGQEYKTEIIVKAGTLPELDPAMPDPKVSGAYTRVVVLGHRNVHKYTDVSAVREFPVKRIG
jgi:hypothetical protein